MEYNENSNTLDITSIYSHPNEVWAIAASPNDTSLVTTSENGCFDNGTSSSVNIWKMSNQTEDIIREGREQRESAFVGNKLDLILESSLQLYDNSSFVKNIKWNKENIIITSDSQYVSVYNVTDGGSNVSTCFTANATICISIYIYSSLVKSKSILISSPVIHLVVFRVHTIIRIIVII